MKGKVKRMEKPRAVTPGFFILAGLWLLNWTGSGRTLNGDFKSIN